VWKQFIPSSLNVMQSVLHQDILDRIEFFPIKCRIQHAKENFRKYQEDLRVDADFWWRHSGGICKLKIKVRAVCG
jgi:hypothetical protein